MDILLLGGNNYLNMLQQCGLALREAGNRVWSIPYWNNVWLLGEEVSRRALHADYDAIVGFCPYNWQRVTQMEVDRLAPLKALWNFDDPYRIRTWTDLLLKDMSCWDGVLTGCWDDWVPAWYSKRGKPSRHVLPMAYHQGLSAGFLGGLCDVLFVGQDYGRSRAPEQPFTRGESVDYLRGRGYAVLAYGDGFEQALPHHYQYPMYAAAPINLGHHLCYGRWVNFRDVYVPDAGGFYLSDDNLGTREIYGDTVAYYTSLEEAADKVAYYLAHEDERKEMAEASQVIAQRTFGLGPAGKMMTEALESLKQELGK